MNFIKKCPVFLIVLISTFFFTATAFAGQDTVYQDIFAKEENTPIIACVFQGMKEGKMPWSAWQNMETVPKEVIAVTNEPKEYEEEETKAEEPNEEFMEVGEAPTFYEFERVTESYFEDAVFIGDSRTVGLFEYAGIEEVAQFYCKTSLTIWNVLEKPIVKTEDERNLISVEQALMEQQFGKVYLMLGINELGRGNVDLFMEQYELVIHRIRELQPNAVIFVEGIMRVAGEKDKTDPIFNNSNINIRNEKIAELADEQNIFYIDVNEAVCDEEGNLRAEYTFDQIHLKAPYYQIWKDFLLEKGIVRR